MINDHADDLLRKSWCTRVESRQMGGYSGIAARQRPANTHTHTLLRGISWYSKVFVSNISLITGMKYVCIISSLN